MLSHLVLGLVLILTSDILLLCCDCLGASKKTLSGHQLLSSTSVYLENDGTFSCSQNLNE